MAACITAPLPIECPSRAISPGATSGWRSSTARAVAMTCCRLSPLLRLKGVALAPWPGKSSSSTPNPACASTWPYPSMSWREPPKPWATMTPGKSLPSLGKRNCMGTPSCIRWRVVSPSWAAKTNHQASKISKNAARASRMRGAFMVGRLADWYNKVSFTYVRRMVLGNGRFG